MVDSKAKTGEEFKITGDWKSRSKELQSKHSELTDEDVKFEQGKESELLKRMQSRLNKGREEVINLIKKTESKSNGRGL